MITGTMHIFAVSGLHITTICFLLLKLLRVMGLTRKQSAGGAVLLLWFYTCAVGASASSVRAAIMSSMLIATWVVERPPSFVNSIAAAALLITILEPLQLFQASFQLSFIVTLAILLMLPWLKAVNEGLARFGVDDFLPDELISNWQKRRIRIVQSLAGAMLISGASWLSSLPLTLGYFHMAAPMSILMNLVVVPVSSAALATSMGSIAIGWFPWLPDGLNHLSIQLMRFCVWATDMGASLRWTYRYAPSPGPNFFLLYYPVFFGLLTLQPKRLSLKRFFALLPLPLLCLLLLIPAAKRTIVSILPIEGSPVIIDQPGTEDDLLIDCSRTRPAQTFLVRYAHSQGINTIPNVLLTHGDAKHVEGYPIVSDEFRPKRVFASPVPFRSKPYKDVLAGIPVSALSTNAFNGSAIRNYEILHPPATAKGGKADEHAVVLRCEVEGVKLLLLGDLDSKGQSELVRNHPDLQADILVASLSEAGDPLQPFLLKQARPKLLIVHSLAYPERARASEPLRERLSSAGIPVAWIEEEGGLQIVIEQGKASIQSASATLMQTGSSRN
jgi:competence protein ComEC